MTSIESKLDYFDKMKIYDTSEMIKNLLQPYWSNKYNGYDFTKVYEGEFVIMTQFKTSCHIKLYLQETQYKVVMTEYIARSFTEVYPEMFDDCNIEIVEEDEC